MKGSTAMVAPPPDVPAGRLVVTAPAASAPRNAPRQLALLGLAVLVRIALLRRPGHAFDLGIYASWGATLAHRPWSEFYAVAQGPDHLPGDLLLHGLLARGDEFLGGTAGSGGYVLLVRLVAIGADLLCAALLGALLAPRLGGRARFVALGYLLCPASWLISAGWGQWDAVGVSLLLGALVVLTRRPDRWWVGIALLTWAVLVKPQLALAAGPAVLGLVLADPLVTTPTPRAVTRRAVGCLAVGLATVWVLCSPFAVGLPALGDRWSLLERVSFAHNRFDAMTLGAPNVWSAMPQPWASDASRVGPVSAATLGTALLVAVCAAGALPAWRRRSDLLVAVLGWSTTNVLAFYVLATRCHERYLFPALVVGIGLAALDRRARRAAAVAAVALSVVIARSLFDVDLGRPVDLLLAGALLATLFERLLSPVTVVDRCPRDDTDPPLSTRRAQVTPCRPQGRG